MPQQSEAQAKPQTDLQKQISQSWDQEDDKEMDDFAKHISQKEKSISQI